MSWWGLWKIIYYYGNWPSAMILGFLKSVCLSVAISRVDPSVPSLSWPSQQQKASSCQPGEQQESRELLKVFPFYIWAGEGCRNFIIPHRNRVAHNNRRKDRKKEEVKMSNNKKRITGYDHISLSRRGGGVYHLFSIDVLLYIYNIRINRLT